MHGSADTETLAELPFGELLERVAARTPAPGGGSAAALVCSLSAALVEMCARFDDAPDRAQRAAGLRTRALSLAERDLTSYEPVLKALQRPAGDEERRAEVLSALSAAAATPMGIAEAAAEVAELALQASEAASRHLVGDSATAAVLAGGACRAAALLVDLNLVGTEDPRRGEAERFAVAAEAAGRKAHSHRNES